MAAVVYLFEDIDAPNEKAARLWRNAGLKSLWDHVLKEGKDEGKKRIYSRTVNLDLESITDGSRDRLSHA